MRRFFVRRLVLTLPILLGVSVVIFVTIKIIPGDPVASLLGPTGTPEARAALTHKLGLDQPLPVQYVKWLWNLAQGDAGVSIAQQQPALGVVWSAFANTLTLTAFAALAALLGGTALGVLLATRRGRPSARLASGFSLFAVSAPSYSLGLIFIVYFAARLGWFPTGGMHSLSSNGTGDLLHHLVLPGLTAALVPLGIIARMVRSSLSDTLGADFVESLHARGLPPRRVLRHVLHNTLPSITTIAGLQLGYLLGGVVFVETIFSWPGLGLLVFNSISQRDLPVIQAGVLVSAVAFVAINLCVDTVHGLIDPRIRR